MFSALFQKLLLRLIASYLTKENKKETKMELEITG